MPMIKPVSKTIRACINRPTETNLKIRAMQMGIPKEQLVGHILKDWCSKAHTQSDTFAQAQSELT